MNRRNGIAVAIVLVVVVGALWLLTVSGDMRGEGTIAPRAHGSVTDEAPATEASSSGPPTAEGPMREPIAADATTARRAPEHGALTVHVRYAGDHAPCAARTVVVRLRGEDERFARWQRVTDEAGRATFADVPAGDLVVRSGEVRQRALVRGNETAKLELLLPVGLTITGRVLDPNRAPVAGATVETVGYVPSDSLPEPVATTDEQGRFVLRGLATTCVLTARAAGFGYAPYAVIHGREGNAAEVELVLGGTGGSIEGIVIDQDGAPIAGALVVVGEVPYGAHAREGPVGWRIVAARDDFPAGGPPAIKRSRPSWSSRSDDAATLVAASAAMCSCRSGCSVGVARTAALASTVSCRGLLRCGPAVLGTRPGAARATSSPGSPRRSEPRARRIGT